MRILWWFLTSIITVQSVEQTLISAFERRKRILVTQLRLLIWRLA